MTYKVVLFLTFGICFLPGVASIGQKPTNTTNSLQNNYTDPQCRVEFCVSC